MRLRVEELAKAADVSVDTVRYYQKQRLLPAPEKDGR
ncbi:MAG: MerR family DNA-binding transcriptional regulator, partial [Acidimicrobiales bacterium]